MNGQFEIGALSPGQYFFAIAALIGLCFAFVAPDDDGLPLGLRLLHWQSQTVGVMAFLIGAHLFLAKCPPFTQLNPWIRLVLSGILGAVVYAPIAQVFDVWFGVEPEMESLFSLPAITNEWLNLVPPAVITWVVINAPWVMGLRLEAAQQTWPGTKEPSPAPPKVDEASTTQPGFFALLPKRIGTDIVLLKSELHYMEVVTSSGRALILYRLRDAIEEMAALDADHNEQTGSVSGLQCHRSYWIAFAHIARLQAQGREGLLVMNNGRSVPVSRRYLATVKAHCARQPHKPLDRVTEHPSAT